MFSNFVHLHVHSEYSLDVGFFRIDDYVKFCYKNKIKVAALTERFNLYSVVNFYKCCLDFGIKPLIGCEFLLEHTSREYSRFILLCQNAKGYQNLTKLITKAYLESKVKGKYAVKRSWLLSLSEGLIAIGLSFESDVGFFLLDDNLIDAKKCLDFWNRTFYRRFYLSLTNFGLYKEVVFTERLLNFSKFNDIFLVATNEVCFLHADDFSSYKSKMAMFDSGKRMILGVSDSYFENRYFKTFLEMSNLFKDMPELFYNSVEISKRCNLEFILKRNYFPKFFECQGMSSFNFLLKLSFEKLFNKFLFINSNIWNLYIERLNMELSVVNKVGFSDYFLVTQDFVIWAKRNDVLVGPGRGSGAGSLIAYLLSITEIDPVKRELVFERFLNEERVSNPDFDIDFCIEGRDAVINYVYKKYGFESVVQIITFNRMTVRSAIRDVGRVLGYSYSFVDNIVKLVTKGQGKKLDSEIVQNIFFQREYDTSYDVQVIINMGLKLEGIVKGIGKHAGGVIISSVSLVGKLPLRFEQKEFSFLTQLDKDDVEFFGFIKFDFLGLKTLSLITSVVDTISAYRSAESLLLFKTKSISLKDTRAFSLLRRADTLGVFQLESLGMKSVIQQMKVEVFQDVIALVALYRPGPLRSGMLQLFINRKLGLEKVKYFHDSLEEILKPTYGMIVYQEQVMLIARFFANYTIGLADFLRIAMSKKKISEMRFHKNIFIKGAKLRGIDESLARKVFFLIEKFAGYGFNKAHSVGYALLAYQTAWLKANYNLIFMAGLLSSDIGNYKSIRLYFTECKNLNLKVLPLDINRSFNCFGVYEESILYGFSAIKGIGKSVTSEIIHNRSVFGSYSCFFDFLYRLNLSLFSKRTLRILVFSGAFDKLNSSRYKLVLICGKIFDLYVQLSNIVTNIMRPFVDDYFDCMVRDFSYMISYKQSEIEERDELLCGCDFNDVLSRYKYDSELISKLSFLSGKYFNKFLCGLIKNIRVPKHGFKKDVILEVTSLSQEWEITLSHVRYKTLNSLVKKNKLIVTSVYKKQNKLYELFIEDFFLFRYKFVKYLDFVLHESFVSSFFLKKLHVALVNKFMNGLTTVRFKFFFNGKYKYIFLDRCFKVSLYDDLIDSVSIFKEIKRVEFTYFF